MKGSVIAFDTVGNRRAAARLLDGRLADLLIDPPEGRIAPGTIYRAKAGRPMKGQGGLICQTPDGPLFLRQSKGIAQGETLLVQTSTWAEPQKAAPATLKLLFKSRFALVTPGAPGLNISRAIKDEERRVELREVTSDLAPQDDIGVVLRTEAAGADDDELRSDLEQTLALARAIIADTNGPPERLLDGASAEEIALRDWPTPDVADLEAGSFERHGIDEAIEALLQPRIALPGGGSMYIEATRAMVAVDVDTGGDTSPAAGLKANVDALRELPRQLRLRGLGGQIVIDAAPQAKGQRRIVEQALKSALKADGIETALVGWTPLGHIELMRKRERLPLSEALR